MSQTPIRFTRVLPWLLLAVAVVAYGGYQVGKDRAKADAGAGQASAAGTQPPPPQTDPGQGTEPAGIDVPALELQLREAESAFARSMAERDLAAFASFLAEDAIFINGREPLRGKAAIVAAWAKYFEGDQAPFAWRPDTVVVLAGGTLGQTKGPVTAADGRPMAEFRSTWRREGDGRWKVVFDDGACLCPAAPAAG